MKIMMLSYNIAVDCFERIQVTHERLEDELMKKIAFIIPYFGKFSNYFPIFLKSCENNPDFDWVIFTDDKTEYNYPQNVNLNYMTFSEMQSLIQNKFEFEICLNTPYKLCDFKVAYGYIFEKYISGYDFWGFCDCDLIFGDLRRFITDEILSSHDRIFTLGHLSLFRNTSKVNQIFKSKYKGELYYKKVFSQGRVYGFDELTLNDMFHEQGARIYTKDVSANISVYHYKFCLCKRDYEMKRYITEDYIPSIFLWDRGKIKRFFYSDDDGTFEMVEFAYIHLQQRNMKMAKGCLKADAIQIMPNSFECFPDIDIESEFANTKKYSEFSRIKKYRKSPKAAYRCIRNRISWKIKKTLNILFPGRFNRAKLQ